MKGLCNKCDKKSKCIKLCEEAETYTNQDFVPYTIETVSEVKLNINNFDEPFDYGTCKSNKKLVYELYFLDGESIRSISTRINIDKSQIGRIVKQLKDNISLKKGVQQRRILKLHFIDKMKAINIANKLNIVEHYISRIINSYLIENKVQ